MTKRKTIYDDYDRDALIATILYRDEVIAKLNARTMDDFVRGLIEEALRDIDR